MPEPSMPPAPLGEEHIMALVRRFYERALADPVLGPYFTTSVGPWPGGDDPHTPWPAHIDLVADFWSHALLGTTRYRGSPFPAHLNKDITPGHFELWLRHFADAAAETLPEAAARAAMGQAQRMAKSFMVGLFPFVDAQGQPCAAPPPKAGRDAASD